MAKLFPSLETIDRLRPAPTKGERALLQYLRDYLRDDFEVYFQPYFNGLRPDVVVMKEGWGVIIIEVKDWDLSSYRVDESNRWMLRHNGAVVKSPHQQVFSYKKSMFDLHIEGLAEARAGNRYFFNILKPFVYFHGATKNEIEGIFGAADAAIKAGRERLNERHSRDEIDFQQYQKDWDYLERKQGHVFRDRGMTLHEGSLDKLRDALRPHKLFTTEIYQRFRRYLQPPMHTKEQGRIIKYGRKQERLTQSAPGFAKIKGVAGCGKTTVLAKRAVNAHVRHGKRVLILTFNLTLRNYIRDKISEVREEFSWGAFGIINYHSFIMDQYRQFSGDPDKYDSLTELFSDEDLFEPFKEKIQKYDTILVDEIQDFERSWIHIIRRYFLAENGEMVLFGDESQNIYNRPISRSEAEIVRGFGAWEKLVVSYRSTADSKLTDLIFDFQNAFLVEKYDIDTIEGHDPEEAQFSLDVRQSNVLELGYLDQQSNWSLLARRVLAFMKQNNVQPNDICILGGEISSLRQLEKAYQDLTGEDTNSTFETQQQYENIVREVDSSSKPPDVKRMEIEERVEPIRRSRKYHFWRNRGTVKLSTVHSYKGLEERFIVYILSGGDSDEIVYTAITRSSRNLLAFIPRGGRYAPFFERRLDPKG